MSAQPIVSVIIPAYNSAETIARAIDSVVTQTYRPIEIIVVDDGSDDKTHRIVEGYARAGARLIKLPERSGASRARNAGIELATGDLVAFLDSDDEWLSTKLEKQVPLLVQDNRMSFISCASNEISADGKDLGDVYEGYRPVIGAEAWKALLAMNFVATPTVVVWRRHLKTLGGFDPNLKIGEDQDMWIRLALVGQLGYLKESLVRVHVRPGSLSSSNFRDQLEYTLPMIERHIAELKNRLEPSEIRDIMGERLSRIGRAAYRSRGGRITGMRLIMASIARRHRPLENILYLATAAPPATWLKRHLRNEAGR